MDKQIDGIAPIAAVEQGPDSVVVSQFAAAVPDLYAFISPIDMSRGYSITESYEIRTGEGIYLNSNRIKELAAIAFAIQCKLPTPVTGTTRLWRGNRKNEVGKNPSYTNSLIGIALPFLLSYKGVLSYVDVPNEMLQKMCVTSGSAKDSEFLLSDDVLSCIRIVGVSDIDGAEIIKSSLGAGEGQADDHWGSTSI